MKLHYTDRHRLPESIERELNLTFHPDTASMVPHCDAVTVNAGTPIRDEYLIVDGGRPAGTGAHSYSTKS